MDGSRKMTLQNILIFTTGRCAVSPAVWELEGWQRDQCLWVVAGGKIQNVTCNMKQRWRTTNNCLLFLISDEYHLSVSFL